MTEVLAILQGIVSERQLIYDRVAHAVHGMMSPDEVSMARIALLEAMLEVARYQETHP